MAFRTELCSFWSWQLILLLVCVLTIPPPIAYPPTLFAEDLSSCSPGGRRHCAVDNFSRNYFLPRCLCLWTFLFLPFHVCGFPRPLKGKPDHLSSGYPLFTCQGFHFFTHPLFFWDTQSSMTLLSFLPIYRNRNCFDASSTTEAMLHIATSLSAQCLWSLHSYFMVFFNSRSKKEHKYKEIDIQIPTFGATVAIMCI